MTPNTNSDNEINVWCDWLTDNGQNSDEIRFEDVESSYWIYEYVRVRVVVGGDSAAPLYDTVGPQADGEIAVAGMMPAEVYNGASGVGSFGGNTGHIGLYGVDVGGICRRH